MVAVLATGSVSLSSCTARAEAAADSKIVVGSQKFVSSMAQKALDFLASDMSKDQKSGEFSKLLQNNFDMETIGKFVLGRYWKTATPEQRETYQQLFRKRIVQIYSNRFEEYTGQKFDVRGARADGSTDAIVSSFIVANDGPEVQVDWRVRNSGGGYKIVDVMVEGVSMSVTQRSDFASVIQQGGGNVQSLISYLKQATAK